MKIILAIGGILAILVLAAIITAAAGQARERSSLDYARESAEMARLDREAASEAIWQPVRAAALNIAGSIVVLSVAVSCSAWAVAAVSRFRHERVPNHAGLLPVRAADLALVAPQALGAFHATQQLAASHAPVPATISYAPHTTYSPHSELDYRADACGAPGVPAAVAAARIAVPTFGELLNNAQIGSGQPMLLGFDRETGAPITGSWLDLYSTAVGGLSGTGKSWTATFLACQAALHGSRLLILDPHAESSESLASRLAPMRARFVCEPASTPAEMLAAVKLAAGELLRRKGGYTRGSAPIVLVADEFAALQRGALAEPLAELIEALGQEGRKLDLFGMVCSQVWSAERAGGTPLRDSLASAYIHRLRPAQARMLSGLTSADLPADLFTLAPGHAYLVTTGGDLRPVIIPQMCVDDVARVAVLAGGRPASEPTSSVRRVGFHVPSREVGSEVGSEAATHAPLRPRPNAENWTPEEARIVALLASGKGPRDVVIEVFGVKGGEKYQQGAAIVAAVIARLAARLTSA
jgi:hypothetical protein